MHTALAFILSTAVILCTFLIFLYYWLPIIVCTILFWIPIVSYGYVRAAIEDSAVANYDIEDEKDDPDRCARPGPNGGLLDQLVLALTTLNDPSPPRSY